MPQANQRVGEYVLIEPIGTGAFGQVWKAQHHVWTEQLVAVKIPNDRRYMATLQSEGIVVNGLQHPNVVRAIAFDPYADVPYLVMEYVPGTSLRPLIRPGGMPAESAVAILRQVLMGLSYAHGRNLIHRDIKPENILVLEGSAQNGFTQPGCVKVTDFGLGRMSLTGQGGPGGAAASIAFSMTLDSPAGKEIAGTLDYMAPEQRSGGAIDGRADLYACGVMLYELLTGEKPAGAEVPSDLNPRSPKSLDDVFRRSYARLDKRYASADEFLAALNVGVGPPPLPSRAPAIMSNVRASSPPPLGGVASSNRHQCPRCRGGVEDGDQFCMNCGTQIVENVRRCPKCGGYPDRTDSFCMFCGQSLAAVAPKVGRPVQGG